jgi:RNA polymerase sigma factor (sigma-70 family)
VHSELAANHRDIDLVQRCLDGDEAALEEIQEVVSPFLMGALANHGASELDAEELVAALWADCVAGDGERPPIFARYAGTAPLRSWLAAIVLNRWISVKRRQATHARAVEAIGRGETGMVQEARVETNLETEMMHVVEQAVRTAIASCHPEEIVLLQLVHLHGVKRRDLAGLAGCHESQLGRRLKATERKIAEGTLATVREHDPLLKLTWEDFVRVCENANILRG